MLRRRQLAHAGVSEVVGTILVLLITVIIFSSIIIWVYNLPTPTATDRIAFSGELTGVYAAGTWDGVRVNLTHLGGEPLNDVSTRIYLTVDNETLVLRNRGTDAFGRPYGINGPDPTWDIGEVWSYRNATIPPTASVSVMVADVERGVVLWDDALLGAGGTDPPVFLDKWVDGDLTTGLTRDPAVEGSSWTLFARIVDPDGDLNPASVHAWVTFGTGSCASGEWYPLTAVGTDTFRRTFSCPAQKAWDGGLIILNATDAGGRESKTRAILRVVDSGIEVTGPNASDPFSLDFGSATQRYDFFEASEWDQLRWDAEGRRNFTKGEAVAVIVATKSIPNPDIRNEFILWDPYSNRAAVYSNPPYLAPVTADSLPSSKAAFTLVDYVAGFYVFEHRFSTSSADHGWDGVQLELGFYPVEITLVTSLTPSPDNRFHVTDALRVTDDIGGGRDYPRLETYRDSLLTQPATSFNFTEVMWVRVVVATAGGASDVDDVILSDAVGRRPVWAPPGTTPVSPLEPWGVDSYRFSVDLSKPNRDSWNFGTSSYSLEVINFQDGDEFYSRLSTQVDVTGPRWKLDIATGLLFKPHETQGTALYGVLFDQQEAWRAYQFETYEQSPGNKAPEDNHMATVLGDLDGDGDLDILVGTKLGNVRWYRNLDGLGHSVTKNPIDTLSSSITGVDVGHIAGPRNLDLAVSTSTGEIWWYQNDGHWTATLVDNVGVRINTLKLADIDGDEDADIMVALDDPSDPYTVLIYVNEGRGVFGQVDSDIVLMKTDTASPFHGTIVQGSYVDTRVSDDQYQQIQEVSTTVHLAAGEIPGSEASVSGTYSDTALLDDVDEVLTEGVVDGSPPSQFPKYTLGTPDGHRYLFPNITADDDDDILEIHLIGRISSGSEPFKVGWSRTGSDPTWFEGFATNQDEAELVWRIANEDWIDETLYLHILDTDQSDEDKDTDHEPSSFAIDHLSVIQTGVEETSSLLKVWETDNIPSGKDAYKFFVEAHRTLISEDDQYRFKYALAPHGPYRDLLTVSKTVDDDVALSVSLPASVGGRNLYIMAQDTNRVPGATSLDSLFVDFVAVQWYEVLPEFPGQKVTLKPWAPTLDFAVADLDLDGTQDVVVAPEGEGEVYVYWGDAPGKLNFSNSRRTDIPLPPGADPVQVEVGLTNGDLYYDIVVGTDDGRVLLYTASGIRSLWIGPTTVASAAGTQTSALRVGDVDGDGWDDVVVGWQSGAVFYYRNDRGGGWIALSIAELGSRIDSLDFGDVDRGDIIRTHPY